MSTAPDMVYEQIAQNAKRIRVNRGLTQNQVADQVGIGAQHVSSIERNKSKLSVPVLVNLAAALDVDIRERLGENIAPIPLDDEIKNLLRDATPKERTICLEIFRTFLTANRKDNL